jgi:glutaryl-CoA dehydrogenase
VLDAEERRLMLRVGKFMNEKVRPVVNDSGLCGEFPFDLVPEFAKLDVAGTSLSQLPLPASVIG